RIVAEVLDEYQQYPDPRHRWDGWERWLSAHALRRGGVLFLSGDPSVPFLSHAFELWGGNFLPWTPFLGSKLEHLLVYRNLVPAGDDGKQTVVFRGLRPARSGVFQHEGRNRECCDANDSHRQHPPTIFTQHPKIDDG